MNIDLVFIYSKLIYLIIVYKINKTRRETKRSLHYNNDDDDKNQKIINFMIKISLSLLYSHHKIIKKLFDIYNNIRFFVPKLDRSMFLEQREKKKNHMKIKHRNQEQTKQTRFSLSLSLPDEKEKKMEGKEEEEKFDSPFLF